MDLRCQYASTHCPNTRSLKISGELHRFCLFHRRSANEAQRRWKQKKLAAANGASSSSEEDVTPKPTSATTRRRQRRGTQDAMMKQENAAPAKRRRTSREIAASHVSQAAQQATAIDFAPIIFHELPLDLDIDALPPLFASDDAGLLDKQVFQPEVSHGFVQELVWASALPLLTPVDCWWSDAGLHQDASLFV